MNERQEDVSHPWIHDDDEFSSWTMSGMGIGLIAVCLIAMIFLAMQLWKIQELPFLAGLYGKKDSHHPDVEGKSTPSVNDLERLLQENAALRERLGLANGKKAEQADQSQIEREKHLSEENQSLRSKLQEIKNNLLQTHHVRTRLLMEISQSLNKQGIEPQLDEAMGRLQFPGVFEFNSGSAVLTNKSMIAIDLISEVFDHILPCYLYINKDDKFHDCQSPTVWVNGIYIEGHTDDIPIRHALFQDNWSLSSTRAAHILYAMSLSHPKLDHMKNEHGEPLLRVVGYGDKRPIADNETDEGRRKNRRVDFYFVMAHGNIIVK